MMRGETAKGIEDIVRRNVAALRSKANLTQQGLADQMLLRGIPWTRETVAQVETTNRRLGFTEAIAVAACLDVPVARLTATGAVAVGVGENEWSAAYLGAAVAGTAGDIYPPESYAGRAPVAGEPVEPTPPTEVAAQSPPAYSPPAQVPPRAPIPPGESETTTAPSPLFAPMAVDEPVPGRRRAPQGTRPPEPEAAEPRGRRATDPQGPRPVAPVEVEATSVGEVPAPAPAPQKAAERIERRMRLRVTASDVDATAQHLWSRSLESERERRVTDRHALTGGSLKTIRGHVSRDLDREIAYEIGRRPQDDELVAAPVAIRSDTELTSEELTRDEATWEATRLNIILANKGYSDSDVTRWWNFTRHRELGDRTIAEAWASGAYDPVIRLIESLPDKHGPGSAYYVDE